MLENGGEDEARALAASAPAQVGLDADEAPAGWAGVVRLAA
jgi:hypothetical protein